MTCATVCLNQFSVHCRVWTRFSLFLMLFLCQTRRKPAELTGFVRNTAIVLNLRLILRPHICSSVRPILDQQHTDS